MPHVCFLHHGFALKIALGFGMEFERFRSLTGQRAPLLETLEFAKSCVRPH